MTRTIATLAFAAAIIGFVNVGSAADEPTYLVTSLDTLYRITPDRGTESWQFPGVSMRGMHRDIDSGEIYVLGDNYGSGPSTVYSMQNGAGGTPTLTTYSQLSRMYAALTKIGDTFRGFRDGKFYEIDLSDPQNPIETFIGDTDVGGSDGAAYDTVTDTLYMASLTHDRLYTVDQADGTPTLIGDFGINVSAQGMEWYDNTLFVAARNADSGYLELGTYSTTTGAYQERFSIAQASGVIATSLAIIPEPGSILLLLIGASLAFRR